MRSIVYIAAPTVYILTNPEARLLTELKYNADVRTIRKYKVLVANFG